ncbi:MAG: RES domain-containing protein [Intrasporangiaceae bacterium]|nr:RES domain-containing protein [Intrasporangiaceae bacterium]
MSDSTPPSGLADPPTNTTDLDGFPAAAAPPQLHRLSEWPGTWWFSSTPDGQPGGRFDLSAPYGTCYLAETLDGALVEKLLRTRTKVIVAERLAELFHATVTVRMMPHCADVAAPRATGFGINGEIHTTLDYMTPRRWAAALRRAGWRSLRYLLRGDPASLNSGRALFGRAGLHRRAPNGMTTQVVPLDRDHAESLLADRGVEVRPIPAYVPIVRP